MVIGMVFIGMEVMVKEEWNFRELG